MKNKILSLLLAVFILYCLLFPLRTANAVFDGLALWYNSILPTLLPFCIFSNIIVQSGVYDRFFELISPVFQRIYPVRSPLIYPLIAGFLFGFPLGSMICAELYRAGKISSKEAETISCISNNFGPVFLYNYLYRNIFREILPPAAVFAACYLPPLLIGRIAVFFLYQNKKSRIINVRRNFFSCGVKAGSRSGKSGKTESPENTIRKPASESPLNIKILDAGIMNGFSTMIRLAGYIILSALLADVILHIPFQSTIVKILCIGAIEVTNGIRQTERSSCSVIIQTLLSAGIVNFGGISGLLQTYSMMKGTGFSLHRYLLFKVLCSISGIILTYAIIMLRMP